MEQEVMMSTNYYEYGQKDYFSLFAAYSFGHRCVLKTQWAFVTLTTCQVFFFPPLATRKRELKSAFMAQPQILSDEASENTSAISSSTKAINLLVFQ